MSRLRRRRVPRLTIVLMTLFVALSGVLMLAQQGACARRGDTFPVVCRRVPSLSLVDPFAHTHLARSRALMFGRHGTH
jgi:hypothetical protein